MFTHLLLVEFLCSLFNIVFWSLFFKSEKYNRDQTTPTNRSIKEREAEVSSLSIHSGIVLPLLIWSYHVKAETTTLVQTAQYVNANTGNVML